MSRLGKKPIQIPSGVTFTVTDEGYKAVGPKGELFQPAIPRVKVEVDGNEVKVTAVNPNRSQDKAFWGLATSLIKNMLVGVTEGYTKKLEINGIGYKAEMKGKDLVLNVGYSHPVVFSAVEGVDISVEKNIITVSGVNKQLVGQVAANIRKIRKPEPYKGKGIKYVDEVIRRKAGKQMKAAGA